MLHYEMALFARVGVPSARLCGWRPSRRPRRSVWTGTRLDRAWQVADLVLLDGDPLARIGDIDPVISTPRAGLCSTPQASVKR
jgi:hypothetical protein